MKILFFKTPYATDAELKASKLRAEGYVVTITERRPKRGPVSFEVHGETKSIEMGAKKAPTKGRRRGYNRV